MISVTRLHEFHVAVLCHYCKRNILRNMNCLGITCIQKSIYFSQHQYAYSDLFNIGGFAKINAGINVDALKEAIGLLVKRHRILCSHVVDKSAHTLSLEEGASVNVHFIDFSADDNAEDAALRWMQDDFHISIWNTEQLFTTSIIKVDSTTFYWYVKAHHLIMDGFSMSVIFDETARIYHQLVFPEYDLQDTVVKQYDVFVEQEVKYLQSSRADIDREWWKARVDRIPDVIDGGSSSAVGRKKVLRSGRSSATINKHLSEKISAFVKQQGISTSQFMLAVFSVVISRLFQQHAFSIGIPVLNRSASDKKTVGPFINILLLILDTGKEYSFKEWLEVVGNECRSAYRHSRLPAAEVFDMTDRQRPPYNILFSYQHFLFNSRFHDTPAEISMLSRNEQEEGLVVQILDYQSGQPACIHFEFRESFLSHEQVSSLSAVYLQMLETCIDSAEKDISQLPLLTSIPSDYLQLVHGASIPGAVRHMLTSISHQTLLHGNQTAIICNGEQFSYRQITQASDILALHLIDIYKASPGTPRIVGVHLERSAKMVVAILAILKSGGCYVPIDVSLPRERMEYIIDDSGLKIIVTTGQMWDNREYPAARLVYVDEIAVEYPEISIGVLPPPEENAPAYLMYTSGSTGQPKGVTIGHAAIANFLSAMQQELQLSEKDTVMAITNISFDISILELFLPLVCGGRVHLITEKEIRDPFSFARSITTSEITFIQGTPSLFRILLSAGWEGMPSATILCGGEPMDMSLARELLKKGKSLWNMYGPTETTVWSSMHRLDPEDEKVYIGRPILNTDILILDHKGLLLPPGFMGEICIGGSGLSSGYHGRPQLTSEKFIAHPFRPGQKIYRTGDVGRWTAGLLEISGRNDEQVKIRGHRVETGEIAYHLNLYPGVSQAAVLAVKPDNHEKELWAYYTAEQEISVNLLLVHLKSVLPSFMCPQYFIRLDEFPLTPNGKIDRKAILESKHQKVPAIMDYVPPDTPEEFLLVRLWENLLDQRQIGINDNFFELGGHSLKATRLISAIIAETGLAITLTDVFEHPTVRGLAARMILLGWMQQDNKSGVQNLSVNKHISI